MADKAIGELPQAASVDDTSLLVVEQQGTAMKMTGAQFRAYGEAASKVYVETAVSASKDAQAAKDGAEQAADRAEAARDSIILDEEKMAQAVADAAGSAADAERVALETEQRVIEAGQEQVVAATEQANISAGWASESEESALLSESWAVGGTGVRTEEDVNNSKYWAGISQAAAEQATTPIAGVYNLILQDRATGERYALIIENGRLQILGVDPSLDAVDLNLIDTATGIAYTLLIENGVLAIGEV